MSYAALPCLELDQSALLSFLHSTATLILDINDVVASIRASCADVVELVDTPDLGSGAVRCGSSSLPIRTI